MLSKGNERHLRFARRKELNVSFSRLYFCLPVLIEPHYDPPVSSVIVKITSTCCDAQIVRPDGSPLLPLKLASSPSKRLAVNKQLAQLLTRLTKQMNHSGAVGGGRRL